MKVKRIIVPCCGVSNLGRLSVDAAQRVTEDGDAEVVALAFVASHGDGAWNKDALLVIDGCDESCASRVLSLKKVKPKWVLDISTLGIEKTQNGNFSAEDLMLVVDAIEAACIDIDAQVPGCARGCACR
ncbi:putative zinc-binding protein [Desulforhopalus sp. IMCC35007]|uniref:putative zinc-binding protein n=1 Tax=Desulforhopalus sp. IMCC35007 TaxID=2569543 RepID=UPI0010ADF83E|nr:putative zinc-binding protein [Desulforhopalus sp. IMCC35007]TKB07168.1 hypothetical protein FCL48_18170 [Desulforhopalus sp. IMCC35007]